MQIPSEDRDESGSEEKAPDSDTDPKETCGNTVEEVGHGDNSASVSFPPTEYTVETSISPLSASTACTTEGCTGSSTITASAPLLSPLSVDGTFIVVLILSSVTDSHLLINASSADASGVLLAAAAAAVGAKGIRSSGGKGEEEGKSRGEGEGEGEGGEASPVKEGEDDEGEDDKDDKDDEDDEDEEEGDDEDGEDDEEENAEPADTSLKKEAENVEGGGDTEEWM